MKKTVKKNCPNQHNPGVRPPHLPCMLGEIQILTDLIWVFLALLYGFGHFLSKHSVRPPPPPCRDKIPTLNVFNR